MKVRTIFLGTPEIAARCFEKLRELPFLDVVHVVTMPDRKMGRERRLCQSPVKSAAKAHAIAVSDAEDGISLQRVLSDLDFDCAIVVAFGVMIASENLAKPMHGFVNLHFSLLPKYRGASPVQSALLHGETKTGVTLFKLEKGMDTGPIIGHRLYDIPPYATHETVFDDLVPLSFSLFEKELPSYFETGTLKAQEHANATYCRKIERDSGRIRWHDQTAKEIHDMWRAYQGWPGIHTFFKGKRLKLHTISVSQKKGTPGVFFIEGDTLLIGAADGSLVLEELQIEGKNRVSARDFMNGLFGGSDFCTQDLLK